MKQSLTVLVEEMKQLESKLVNGIGNWEDICGYSLNDELSPFLNLTEEFHI